MRFVLFLLLGILSGMPALAQEGQGRQNNPVVPNQQCTDDSTRAANTHFVHQCAGSGGAGISGSFTVSDGTDLSCWTFSSGRLTAKVAGACGAVCAGTVIGVSDTLGVGISGTLGLGATASCAPSGLIALGVSGTLALGVDGTNALGVQ